LAGVGCAALADHLRAASWPPKFRPHLPEKYDGTSKPSEFLQVYVTAITARGQTLNKNRGGALWSGADGPRPGAGQSATWRRG
jgi:hypothetical protein